MSSRIRIFTAALAVAVAGGLTATAVSRAQSHAPAFSYTADGKLNFPKDYRTWVYLSTGLDMAYVENAGMGDLHMFDSVFVNREAYDAYQRTGTWPDKTIMVLEVRRGVQNGSINKKGHFQADRIGLEAHVKDTARFKSGWAFFPLKDEANPTVALPQTSQCNVCHEEHAAVDTTFVQFYPTLMAKAQEMKTLSAAYVAEEAKAKTEKR
jgi:hypothetical protein